MGLDMYMYKAVTPGIDSDKTHKYEDLQALGYSIFDDKDLNEKYLKDLKQMAVPCMVEAEFTDWEKMRQELGTEEIPEIYGLTQGVFFLCADGKNFTMSEDEFRKYSYPNTQKFWVIKFERIGYWRNEHDLQEYIYELKKKKRVNVENCGYYLMSPEQLELIDNETDGEYGLRDYKNDKVYYHEWY